MAIPFHKNITSLSAIYDTILLDRYVYRWFIYLVLESKAVGRFDDRSELKRLAGQLRCFCLIQAALSFLIVLDCIMWALGSNPAYLLLGIATAVLYFLTLTKKRHAVAKIGLEHVKEDFSEADIGGKTLFQICEHYSKTYNTPSLVEAIYKQDRLYRVTVVLILMVFFFIYPMRIDWIWIAISIGLYFLVVNISNVGFFYKRITGVNRGSVQEPAKKP